MNFHKPIKPAGASAVVFFTRLIGGHRYRPSCLERSGRQVATPEAMLAFVLVSPLWQQPTGPSQFVMHESQTHITANITFVVCVRLQTAPEISSYGAGLCVCVGSCVTASVYCGHITCAPIGLPSVNLCLFIHLLQPWLIPAITASGAGVNGLSQVHLMVCGTAASVGALSLRGETVMKHSRPNHCQHIAHAFLRAPTLIGHAQSQLWAAIGQCGTAQHASPSPTTALILISNNGRGSGARQKTGHLMKQSLDPSICNTNGLMGCSHVNVKRVIKAVSTSLTFLAVKINHDSN